MFRGKKFVGGRDRTKQRRTRHTTQNANDTIEVKKDFVNIFSDELNLHVFRYLSAVDVSICSQVSRKWWRIANDRQSLFLSRFKAPNRPNLTYRLETLQLTQTLSTNLPKSSIIANNEGIGENDISDSEDWKNIYRVSHNWQTGNCHVIDFKPYDNLVQDRDHVQNSLSLLTGYIKNQVFSFNTNSNPLVQFTKHIILTASSSNPNGNNIPEIHLWRAGKHNEHIDTLKSIILSRISATHGCKNPIYITCLKLDSNERDDHLGVCKFVSGYSNGGFTIWEFDTLERDENEKPENDWKHRELYTIPIISNNASPLIACSLDSPILITCNKDFVLSIYYIDLKSRDKEKPGSSKDNKNFFIYENLVECQLIHQLKSFVCWTPIEISIKCSQEKLDQSATNYDVEQNIWIATIVYSTPMYGGGWTAGIQEIKFSTITLLSTKHCSYLPSSTTLPFVSIAPITTITYNSGQLVTAHADNTLQVYYVLDNGKTLECKHVQTLYGHTGSVMSVAMDENGKLITGAMDQTIKIWDLGWNPEKNYNPQNNNVNARELKGYHYNHNDDFSFVGLIARRKKHGECIVTLNDSLSRFNDSSCNISQSKIKNWGIKWVGFDEGRIVSVCNGEAFDDQEAQMSKSLPSPSGWPGLSLSKNIITGSNSNADIVEEAGIVKVWSFCE
ncbi:2946_t:CDS:2 [Racocetra fulgida]|uniref:2946_t:CDS:1 n=1 Tax=Racocetra fulgida TaxID=60492 RepID=A0A9N8WDM2_9GLOM|nr:2946_t:CDS:2 [Racocetra fulgida]